MGDKITTRKSQLGLNYRKRENGGDERSNQVVISGMLVGVSLQ